MTDQQLSEYEAANLANWNERVAPHLVSYRTDEFVADPENISHVVRFDRPSLESLLPGGSVAGKSLVHLQCHIGTDTLSWAKLGADVTGVDFSPAAIDACRDLATRAGIDARFECCTIEDAPAVLDRRYDVVYTGIGAICWLADLDSWARTIHDLLEVGGTFFIRDAHPILDSLAEDTPAGTVAFAYSYFEQPEPLRWDDEVDYMDESLHFENATEYCWSHSLSQTVTALLNAGLSITSLAEHRSIPWKGIEQLVADPGPSEEWRLPEGAPDVPLSFSLSATRRA